MAIVHAAFAIIAGGSGTRLGGVPKGLLRVGGSTILERQLLLDRQRREQRGKQQDACR